MKYFKFVIVILIFTLMSCDQQTPKPEVNITTAINPSDGLDFKLVGALFQDGVVTNAESLEKELNKAEGINNLDLDSNGKTDYINISENEGDGQTKSFDLTTGDTADPTYVGTVEVEKTTTGTYNINMAGSEQIYGSNYHYNTSFNPSLSEMMFYNWMFSPRARYYHQPYHYGYYPSYYSPRVVVNRTTYVSRTSVQRTKTKSNYKRNKNYKPKTKSSNRGKVSKNTKSTLTKYKPSKGSAYSNKSNKSSQYKSSKSKPTSSSSKYKSNKSSTYKKPTNKKSSSSSKYKSNKSNKTRKSSSRSSSRRSSRRH